MVINADKRRLALVDDGRKTAETADVADVERRDDVSVLNLTHGMRAGVGPLGDQEVEAFGDAGGIRDRHRDATRSQQVPEADFAADPVAVGIDVGRQHDVLRGGERRRNVTSRPRTLGRNGNAVRVHVGRKIIAR